MASSTLDSIPILKPGIVLEHMRETIQEDEWKILSSMDGKMDLGQVAVKAGLPREMAREIGLRLCERQLILLASPDDTEDARSVEQHRIVPGMKYLDDVEEISIRGQTTRENFPKLLIRIQNEKLTGVFRAMRPKMSDKEDDYYKNIYFLGGNVVDCRTHPFQPSECLGRILQRAGRVDEKVVLESLKRVKAGGIRQGEALVQMGAVSPEFLQVALANQLEYKIGEILEWDKTIHDFSPKEGFSKKIARIDCSLPYLLFNAIWKRYPLKEIEKKFSQYKEKYLGKTEAPLFNIDSFLFEKVLGKFWEVIMLKDLPFKRLLIVSNLKKEQTLRTLFGLYVTGMVEFLVDNREDPTLAMAEVLKEETKNLEKRSHFDALAIHWTVDNEKIEAAFRKRISQIRKDMSGHEGLIRMMYENMAEMVENAYHEIKDPVKRRAYREKIYDPYFIEFNADILRQKGESFMFTKDEYDKAIVELETSIEVLPSQGEYHALLGLALFLRYFTEDPMKAEEGARLIRKGTAMAAQSDVGYLCEGLMSKREGRMAAASTALTQAVKLNPQNRFAKIELKSLTTNVTEAEREAAIKEYVNRKAPATEGDE